MSALSVLKRALQQFSASSYCKDISWLAAGNILAQAIYALSTPAITRLYSPGDFAVQSLFISTTSVVTMLISLRFDSLLPGAKTDADAMAILKICLGLPLLVVLVSFPLLYHFRHPLAKQFGADGLAIWIAFIPVCAGLSSISTAFQGFAQRFKLYRRSAESIIIGRVAFLCTVFVGCYILPEAGGLICSWLLLYLGRISWLLRQVLRNRQTKTSPLLTTIRKYLFISGSLASGNFVFASMLMLMNYFISHQFGEDTLGQYAVAFQLIALPTALIGTSINQVFYQRSAKQWKEGRTSNDLRQKTLKKLALLGIVFYSPIILLAPMLLPVILGAKWHLAGHITSIIGFDALFAFVAVPVSTCFIIVDNNWYFQTWQFSRLAILGVLILLTVKMGLPFFWFLSLWVFCDCLMYALDIVVQGRFARISPCSPSA